MVGQLGGADFGKQRGIDAMNFAELQAHIHLHQSALSSGRTVVSFWRSSLMCRSITASTLAAASLSSLIDEMGSMEYGTFAQNAEQFGQHHDFLRAAFGLSRHLFEQRPETPAR